MQQHSLKLSTLALALTTALSGQALAQDNNEQTDSDVTEVSLERIEVTARKQVESLQEVPVSVTSIGAMELAEKGITDVTDIQQHAPNTTLQVSRGTNSTLTAYIRGIGQQDPLWGFEPGVGIYVDDVYIARPQGAVMEILDIERVEVLRGPQGTLYGKNTIGGAMKYVTRKMTGMTEFDFSATVGSYGQNDYKVSAQVPIIEEKLFFGFAWADLNRDGFGEFRNTGEDNYNKDIRTGRANLAFHATDDLVFRLAYDETSDHSNAKGGYRLTPSVLTGQEVYDDVFDSDISLPVFNRVRTSGTSFTAEWTINDHWSFKSVTADREGDTYTNIDFDSTALKSFDVPAIYDDEQFTQEFQLNYFGDGIKAVGGLYYYDGDACGAFDVQLEVLGQAIGLPGFTLENGGCTGTKSFSAYGQTSFDLSDKWSMTLGGRYTKDEKDAFVYRHTFFDTVYPGQLEAGEVTPIDPQNEFVAEESWSHFSPRIGVEYQANKDLMYFASYTDGFKSGGFNMRADIVSDPEGNKPFDPEVVDTLEAGFKSEWLDNRWRLNGTLFYSEYSDMQVTVQRATANNNFVARVLNAGQAEMKGFELESLYGFAPGAEWNLTVGFIDAEFVEFLDQDPNTGEIVNRADDLVISNTPEWTVNTGVTYDWDTNWGNFVFTSNVSYRSETHIFEAPSQLDQPGYTLVNLGLNYYHSDGNWSGSLQVENAFDKEYRVAGYDFADLGLERTLTGFYGDPRTVSLKVKYTFF